MRAAATVRLKERIGPTLHDAGGPRWWPMVAATQETSLDPVVSVTPLSEVLRMRKLLAVATMVAFSSGCALTNYPVITDRDQVRQANGTHIVNTTGRAFVAQKV